MAHLRTLAAIFLLIAAALQTGCAAQCPQVKGNYEDALLRESALEQELPDALERREDAVHVGFALKTDLLNDMIAVAMRSALKTGLTLVSSIRATSGVDVGIETEGDILNLRVASSDACDNCFKISGSLDGSVSVRLPIVGRQAADLGGSLSLVAPIKMARRADGRGAIQLDLKQVARLGKSSIATKLSGLPNTWSRALQGPLGESILNRLTDDLKPITLLNYDPPSLGIPGLEIVPVKLSTNARTETVFAGFTTNIEALSASNKSIAPITDLDDDENIAFAFQPELVVHALSLMMQKDELPRTYSTQGEPLRGGPAHVTIRGLRFERGRVGELPMKLGFQVHHFSDRGPCFWFDGLASGRIAIRGKKLEVSLTDVEITRSSLPTALIAATDWLNAEFLRGGKRIMRTSLDDQNLKLPGGRLDFVGLGVELREGSVVLRGNSASVQGDS